MTHIRLSSCLLLSSWFLLACPQSQETDPSTSEGTTNTSENTTNPTTETDKKTCEDFDFVECGGRCVDVNNDPAHCGDCGKPCGENEVCWAGECINSCDEGLTRCVFETDEMTVRACIQIQSDLNHCGRCNNACATPQNGTVECMNKTCQISCNQGFAPRNNAGCVACDGPTPLESNPTAFWRLGEPGNLFVATDVTGNFSGAYVDMQERLFLPGATVGGDAATRFGSAYPGRMRVENFSLDQQNPTSTAVSVEFWLKRFFPLVSGNSGSNFVLSYGALSDQKYKDELAIYFKPYEQIIVNIGAQELATGVSIEPDHRWYHVVLTWDSSSGEIQVFVDGVKRSAEGLTFQKDYAIPNGGSLVLGQDQDALDGSFNQFQELRGALDEFAIYPFVLSPEQVRSHFNSAFCPN